MHPLEPTAKLGILLEEAGPIRKMPGHWEEFSKSLTTSSFPMESAENRFSRQVLSTIGCMGREQEDKDMGDRSGGTERVHP